MWIIQRKGSLVRGNSKCKGTEVYKKKVFPKLKGVQCL